MHSAILARRSRFYVFIGLLACGLALLLQMPSRAADRLDITGKWCWAMPGEAKHGKVLPEGKWSGTFTIAEEKPGLLTGKFSDSPMDEIKVEGNSISFSRTLAVADARGRRTQYWSGSIEQRKDGGLQIKGKFTGAFEDLPRVFNIPNTFLATKTEAPPTR